MLNKQTDADWEWFGKNDPYYGVLSKPEFSKENFLESNRSTFFQHGEEYVEKLFGLISESFLPKFTPNKVLDFGCGVGRVTIPLAKRCKEIFGVDISRSMLENAEKNCEEMGVTNAKFIETSELDSLTGKFDFIHSFIVFQHMPSSKGEMITRKLIRLLALDGIGALHYTYRHHETKNIRGKLIVNAYRYIPFAYRIRRFLKKEPVMQMNEYDIGQILSQIQDLGCRNVNLRFTNHGECRGVLILFQRGPSDAEYMF